MPYVPVSYTHLDVYKRQIIGFIPDKYIPFINNYNKLFPCSHVNVCHCFISGG